METNRQKKIGGVLQKDLADVLQSHLRDAGRTGILISVSKVKVTTDLSQAKAYLSIFPAKNGQDILKELNLLKPKIKHELAQRTKNQLRRMPNLDFYIDDSLDYIENIEKSIKGEDNPIEQPDLLSKRKKS
ncbi:MULTISPECIES: 30S ribosome-binding factor RbfA [Salinimicrobium]|uniref:30S ribosome-binding factor RbfA n=1 Tax=Salinimicrobium TaxID=561367 RepID=UPI001E3EDE0D|nr:MULTISPECIES: 30S ribosome-binding factor RbfA [Salinimicrobium]MCC8359502.1 30S ribosome-binding factor RbfA [Salinimicrobium sediminilitoris]MCY2686491.1 30S ribosome-binding factor RbfA [Salinimicrobium sp. TH3]